MTMLEKAARALAANRIYSGYNAETRELEFVRSRSIFESDVLTVLRAIREPDDAMLEALRECSAIWAEDKTLDDYGKIYTATIDAILAEGTKKPARPEILPVRGGGGGTAGINDGPGVSPADPFPRRFIVASTFQQASLTAEIDWKWERIGERKWCTPEGVEVHYCGSDMSQWFCGLPNGTEVYLACGHWARRDAGEIRRLILLNKLVEVRP